MNEEFLKSAVTVLALVQQRLLAELASQDVISLKSLHTEMTGNLTAHLASKNPDDPTPLAAETAGVGFLDHLFQGASDLEAAIRDAQDGE